MKTMKPEARVVWDPETFLAWLPETVASLCREAKAHGKDIEVLSEHRKEGEFELRIKIVEPGHRMMDLPPIAFTARGKEGR